MTIKMHNAFGRRIHAASQMDEKLTLPPNAGVSLSLVDIYIKYSINPCVARKDGEALKNKQ